MARKVECFRVVARLTARVRLALLYISRSSMYIAGCYSVDSRQITAFRWLDGLRSAYGHFCLGIFYLSAALVVVHFPNGLISKIECLVKMLPPP